MVTSMPDYQDNRQKYILCIDDEKSILDALYIQLSEQFSEHYEIECAESGREALELFDTIYREVNVAVAMVTNTNVPVTQSLQET